MKAFFRNVRDYINALRGSNVAPATGAIGKSAQLINSADDDGRRPITIDQPTPAERASGLIKAKDSPTPGNARITHPVSAGTGNSHASA